MDIDACQEEESGTADSVFLDIVQRELENFVRTDISNSVLCFPALSNRLRFLTHRLVEEQFESLCSFSVGKCDLRRTAVCSKSRLALAQARQVSEKQMDGGTRAEKLPSRTRRPDMQLYVPRGRSTASAAVESGVLATSAKKRRPPRVSAAEERTSASTPKRESSPRRERAPTPRNEEARKSLRESRSDTTVGVAIDAQDGFIKCEEERRLDGVRRDPEPPRLAEESSDTSGSNRGAQQTDVPTSTTEAEGDLAAERGTDRATDVVDVETFVTHGETSNNELHTCKVETRDGNTTAGTVPTRESETPVPVESEDPESSSVVEASGTDREESNGAGGPAKALHDRESSDGTVAVGEGSVAEGDSWDAMFDDDGECLDPGALKELTQALGEVEIRHAELDYTKFEPQIPDLGEEEYGHILEVYGFPAEFETKDLVLGLSSANDPHFTIKWVDDTHALAVFSSPVAASEALAAQTSLLKVRHVSEASKQSKLKVKRCAEFLLPFKPRPQTSATVARRMVSGALGVRVQVRPEQRRRELQAIKEAKTRRHQKVQQQRDVWNGDVS